MNPSLLPAHLQIGVDVIKDELSRIGNHSGVYRMLSDGGDVLYVGKAKSLKKRVVSYTRPLLLPVRLQRMIAETRRMEFITTKTEAEALLLEANLIKTLKPRYNVLLKDDKTYPYIMMTTHHDFPQVMKFRGRPKKDAKYFGPFASATAVNETLSLLQRVFMLRNCTDAMFDSRKTPCLQYHIKRCTAPCVGKVTLAEYAGQVQNARDFLDGKSRQVQDRLQAQMAQASVVQDYEFAALYRDKIKMLTQIQSRQGMDGMTLRDADVVGVDIREGIVCVQVFFYRGGQSYGNRALFMDAVDGAALRDVLSGFMAQFYEGRVVPPVVVCAVRPKGADLLEEGLGIKILVPQRGEKMEILDFVERNAKEALARHLVQRGSQSKIMQSVAELFGLEDVPQRIEIYDNSHTGGTNMIGAMVVASPDGFEKNSYRKFNIRMAEAADDYGMMREVMLRRFSKIDLNHIDINDKSWPALLLIDGGLGQLNAVHEVLDELGVSDYLMVVGIAKGEDRNAGREKFFMRGRDMFQLPVNDPTLHYLQRLRDEAHRFAIGTHRAKRQKAALGSQLNDVPGIGAKRKKALLLHFGSAKAVMDARVEDLEKVDGVSRALADKIYDYFHTK